MLPKNRDSFTKTVFHSRTIRRPKKIFVRGFNELNPIEKVKSPHSFSDQYLNLAHNHQIQFLRPKDTSLNVSKISRMSSFRIKTETDKSEVSKKSSSPISFIPIQLNRQSVPVSKTFRNMKFPMHNTRYSNFRDQARRFSNHSKKSVSINETGNIINPQYSYVQSIVLHFQMLWEIRNGLILQKVNEKNVVHSIKSYVLQKKKIGVAHFHELFNQQNDKRAIKQLVFLERSCLLGIVDSISKGRLQDMLPQIKLSIDFMLGFYKYLLEQMLQNTTIDEKIKLNISEWIKKLNKAFIQKKCELTIICKFLSNKLSLLFKCNQAFYRKIKEILCVCKQVTINRAFYDLLTLYAIYLNIHQDILHKNYGIINSFATCPSPYLTKNSSKPYTFVTDLDDTLVLTDHRNNTHIRPYAQSLLAQLSQYYQIIVFTCAMPEHADKILANFKNIDHVLYRYHAMRLKGGFLKDLKKIGRPLNKIVIIDDNQINYHLHKENGIKISAWLGDQGDSELKTVKDILLGIAQQSPLDIRTMLNSEHIKIGS